MDFPNKDIKEFKDMFQKEYPILDFSKSFTYNMVNLMELDKINIEYETDKKIDGYKLSIFFPTKDFAILLIPDLYFDGYNENYSKQGYTMGLKLHFINKYNINVFIIYASDIFYDLKSIILYIDMAKSKIKIDDYAKTIYPRKCEVKILSRKEASVLLDNASPFGLGTSRPAGNSVYIGLIFENEVITVGRFIRKDIKEDKGGIYSLSRYAVGIGLNVPGAYGKIEKFLLRNFKIKQLVTHCGLNTANPKNNIYLNNGYKLIEIQQPGSFWIQGIHEFNWVTSTKKTLFKMWNEWKNADTKRKEQIEKEHFYNIGRLNENDFENMNREKLLMKIGYKPKWDAGNMKYEKNVKSIGTLELPMSYNDMIEKMLKLNSLEL